jgi:hypothetical protein
MSSNNIRKKKSFTYDRADGRRSKMIVSRERERYVSKVSEDISFGCYSRVERDLNVPRATIRYWYLKSWEDHSHESGSCGGWRSGTFQIWEQPIVQQYIVEFLTAFPNSTIAHISNELSYCFSRNVSKRV